MNKNQIVAVVAKDNANNEFSFRKKDNHHLDELNRLLPDFGAPVSLFFGNLEVQTTLGANQNYLRAPEKCLVDSHQVKDISYKELVEYLGVKAGQLIIFESVNCDGRVQLNAIEFGYSMFSVDNSGHIKSGYIDKKSSVLVMTRRGQASFRSSLISRYQGKCAISNCQTIEALEAAHVVPHSVKPSYMPQIGLLLRGDIHTLFDLYLLSINPQTHQVEVSSKCCSDYTKYEGTYIDPMPDPEVIKLHYHKFTALS